MKRRLALTFAGSAAIVLTAGSAAVAANLGILSSASQEPVGKLDASSVAELTTPVTSLDPVVVTQDVIIEVPVDETTTIPAPAPDNDDSPAVGGSSSGPSSNSGPGSGGVTTTTAPRIDNSGPGSIDDDHSGSDDDHSGSDSGGSGSSGSSDDD
jgi:hypothetical protein